MNWITPDLHVKSRAEAGMWETTQPVIFDYNGMVFEVPVGFVTDLASIPRGFRWLFSVNGKHRRAAVLHDWLYETKYGTRKECDKIFHAAMRAGDMNGAGAWTMHAAVRLGGWLFWDKD